MCGCLCGLDSVHVSVFKHDYAVGLVFVLIHYGHRVALCDVDVL